MSIKRVIVNTHAIPVLDDWSTRSPKPKQFDAATEFGALIKELSVPVPVPVVIMDLAISDTDRNRNGVIRLDGKIIEVGCSTISFAKVEETYKAMLKLHSENK